MRRKARHWGELVRSLGDALLALLGAELEALQGDFSRTGKTLAVALLLAGGALALVLWTAGVLTAGLVALFALWLPVWGAALVVAAILLVIAAGLAGLAWHRLRRLEGPVQTVSRRWEDHTTWWRSRIAGHSLEAGASPRGDDDGSGAE